MSEVNAEQKPVEITPNANDKINADKIKYNTNNLEIEKNSFNYENKPLSPLSQKKI